MILDRAASFLVLVPALLPAQEPTRAERLRFLEDELEKRRVELHIPGLAISVVQGDEVIWAKGFGLADVEGGRPVTPETIFAIGSTTKAFTATLVGMLVDEGKLAWDAPITEVLPDFRLAILSDDPSAAVTLRDLLAHRTGFSRGDILWGSGKADARTILATVVKAEPWAGFREEFHYNNVMFLAAGEALAKVAGKPWPELLAERLLVPLGMKDSNASVALVQEDARLALGYEWDEAAQRFEHQPMRRLDAIAPAGAINSNVLDMARWVRFQLGRGELEGRRLISAEAHAETWTEQIDLPGGAYGLGWGLLTWNGQRVVEHGGNIDGFAAQVALLPDAKLGYVLLANVSATPLQSASMQLVWNALLGDLGAGGAAHGSPAERGPYLGTYLADFGSLQDAKLTVLEQHGKLALDVPGQMVYTLKEPDADGKWFFEATDQIAVSFDRNPEGDVTVLKLYQADLVFEAPREGVELPAEIDLDDARRFLGKYHDPDLKADVTIVIQNKRLAADVPNQMVYELHAPDAEGKRALRAIASLAVRFDEGADGVVTGLTFFEDGAPERACPRVADAAATALPSPEALHELRGSDARAAALAALGGYRLKSKVKLVHAGIEGTAAAAGEGLARWRSTVDLEPFATIDSCYDDGFGAIGGSLTPYDELAGKYLEEVRLDHPLACALDWRSFYATTVVLRADELDGRQAWVVELGAGDDLHVTAWVDAETGDTLREDRSRLLPGGIGELPTTTTYSDFRLVEGLRLPYRAVSEDEASGRAVYTVESFEAHLDLDRSAFRLAPPEAAATGR